MASPFQEVMILRVQPRRRAVVPDAAQGLAVLTEQAFELLDGAARLRGHDLQVGPPGQHALARVLEVAPFADAQQVGQRRPVVLRPPPR